MFEQFADWLRQWLFREPSREEVAGINAQAGLESFFTNAVDAQETFVNLVSAESLPKNLLVLHGIGGIGKSTLLKMYRLYCFRNSVPIGLVDAAETVSPDKMLDRWSEDLRGFGFRFSAFENVLQNLQRLEHQLEDRPLRAESVLKLAIAMGADTIPIAGPLVEQLGGSAVTAAIDRAGAGFTRPDMKFYRDPTEQLVNAFVTDLHGNDDSKRVVLMIDTYERTAATDSWTCKLAQILPKNILLVVAGRSVPNWSRSWPCWQGNAWIVKITEMSPLDMEDLIRKYYAYINDQREPDPSQVEAIVKFSRGLPLVATTVVGLWQQTGIEDFRTVQQHVAEELVVRLTEGMQNQLRDGLEVAAILRYFNEDALNALLTNTADAKTVYTELTRWPFITGHPKGKTMHTTMRAIIGDELRGRSYARFAAIQRAAAGYYEQLAQQATGGARDQLILDYLYHLVQADEASGMKIFCALAESLAKHRLVNRLRAILNDASSYTLRLDSSREWMSYYHVRLLDMEGKEDDAIAAYTEIYDDLSASLMLRAYAVSDLGWILSRFENSSDSVSQQKAIEALETSTEIWQIDGKLARSWLSLAWIYRRNGDWEAAFRNVDRALDYFRTTGDDLNLAEGLTQKVSLHTLRGEWEDSIDAKREVLTLVDAQPDSQYARARILGRWSLEIWIGRLYHAEHEFRESARIAEQILDERLLREASKRLAWTLQLQGKLSEAQSWFERSLELDGSDLWASGTTKGFWGLGLLGSDLDTAEDLLRSSLANKRQSNSIMGLSEVLNGLGMLYEIKRNWKASEEFYGEALEYGYLGRQYFTCGSYVGLARVMLAKGNHGDALNLVDKANEIALRNCYNDLLAMLRLIQGHLVLSVNHMSSGVDIDAAQVWYQQAILCALRYNRFALDQILGKKEGVRSAETLIGRCLRNGQEGQRLLRALQTWWNDEANSVPVPGETALSNFPAHISLAAAERHARIHEPGNGLHQRTVNQQLEAAIHA